MALRDEVLADDPGIYLELNEPSGSLIAPDSSGKDRHANRIAGGPNGLLPIHSINGGAIGRGRSSEYPIQIPQWYQILNNWTFMIWVAPNENITVKTQATTGVTGNAGDQRYAAISPALGYAGACLSVGRNAIQVFEYASGYLPCVLTYSPATPFELMRFICVHIVCTNKQYNLYVNGVLVKTGVTSTFVGSIAPLEILSDYWSGGFTGGVDEVAWWPTVLSDARIAAHSASVAAPRPKAQYQAAKHHHFSLIPSARPVFRAEQMWMKKVVEHARDFAPTFRAKHQVAKVSLGPLPESPTGEVVAPPAPLPTWWPITPASTRYPVAP